jgi:hypothetical protein
MTAYMVRGPQSALPFPRVKDATSLSALSTAMNDFVFLSGTKDTTCWGSSVSLDISYSLYTVSQNIWKEYIRINSYLSFPSTVITNNVDPASPHGCHSIFAIGAEFVDA